MLEIGLLLIRALISPFSLSVATESVVRGKKKMRKARGPLKKVGESTMDSAWESNFCKKQCHFVVNAARPNGKYLPNYYLNGQKEDKKNFSCANFLCNWMVKSLCMSFTNALNRCLNSSLDI